MASSMTRFARPPLDGDSALRAISVADRLRLCSRSSSRSRARADSQVIIRRPVRIALALPLLLALALSSNPARAQSGRPVFEHAQPELFAAGGTLVNAWADYDGDGDPDLFVGFGGPPNRLYRNHGGTFTDVAAEAGINDSRATRAAAWGDYDNDGDPDLLLGFAPGPLPVLRLYRNDGERFTNVTADAGLAMDSAAVRQLTWIDHDSDGDLDLFVALRDRANALFRNDRGRFQNVATQLGLADPRRSVGAVWFDFDQDGDLDLVVGNQDGDANRLYRNHGGRFTDIAAAVGIAWGGRAPEQRTNGTVRPCADDVDNDGRLDLFFANYGPNGLFLARGDRFEDVSATWGVAIDARYDSCAFADVDNDGRLDLYVNGTVTGGRSYRDYLFINRGDRFEDVTPANLLALQASHGVQWTDFDHDGDLDLALTGAAQDGTHAVLRNLLPSAQAAHSLQVTILDGAGHATRAGTEVRVYVAGSSRLLGTRLVDAGSGYNSQSVLPVHFGLGTTTSVDVGVAVPTPSGRRIGRVSGVDTTALTGRPLILRVDHNGRITRGTLMPDRFPAAH